MHFYMYLIFLISLSGLSLVILYLLRILDIAKATSKQKIFVIKIGLSVLGLAPVIFSILRMLSWQTIEVSIPTKFINQPLTHFSDTTLTIQDINWPYYVFIVYIICFLVMLSQIIFSYFSAKRLLAQSLPVIIHGQSIFLNKNISSPLSFGFPVAKIYMPIWAKTEWTHREIEMCLSHENIHLMRNDPLWKLLSLLIRAALFFAPWSYSLHQRLELEMEIHCDEATRTSTNANIKEYGDLLLGMTYVQSRHLIFTNMTDSTLKRRFLAMKSKKIQRPYLTFILSAILLSVGTASVATTSGITGKKSVFNIVSKIYVDGELMSSPRIITRAGQKASINLSDKGGSNRLDVELIASDASNTGVNDAIRINYDLQYKYGNENTHSKPRLVVLPKQQATIRFTSDSGHLYEMRVLAERE